MILLVEDGQGLPDSNSYISESDVMNLLPSSSLEEWNLLTQDERIDRLVAASQFIDISFEWVGTRKTLEQGFSWPRVGVSYQGHEIPDDIIPQPIKKAVVMSLLIINDQGLEVFRSTGEAQVKREKFAVMETEYFDPKILDENKSGFDDINNLLRGFYIVQKGSGMISVEVLRK